jgi:hypothetical protein
MATALAHMPAAVAAAAARPAPCTNRGRASNARETSYTKTKMPNFGSSNTAVPRSVGFGSRPAAATVRASALRGPSVRFLSLFGKKDAEGKEKDAAGATEAGVSYDLLALDSGDEGAVQAAADVFERVDDVVMGGVSSSVIGPAVDGRDCLVWAGKCRAEGGGFAVGR